MNVYTVIVTYKGLKWIEKCINSVYNVSKVVVVDNNSPDETVSVIKNKFPDVVLLPQEDNKGFGVANNIGISYALKHKADAVFLLNQDAYADNNCIENLVKASKKNVEYGILTPVHYNWKGTELDHSFFRVTGPYSGSNIISDLILKKYSKLIYPLKFINAAAWFIPRDVFYKVGGFDPIFFMYGEDENYAQRILYHGYKIGAIPNATIYHDCSNEIYRVKKTDTIKYIQDFRNRFIVKYADINTNNYIKSLSFRLYLIKLVLKNILVFNISEAKLTLKKYSAIKDVKTKNKVVLNRKVGPRYLEI